MLAAKIFAVVALVTLTFDAGLRVQFRDVAAVFRNGSLIARVVIANFIVIPLLGLLLARGFALSPDIATGFLLMAIAPGVPGILLQLEKKGGSIGTSVALAVLLPVLSVITVPLTADMLLPREAMAQLPLAPFVMKLVLLQFVPLALGMLLGERMRERVLRLRRVMIAAFVISLVGFVIILAPVLAHAVTSIYGERGGVAALVLIVASFIVGYAFGGPTTEDRRVLALGTMLRNVGLAATVATTSFGGGDVAAAVLTYFVIQVFCSLIAGTLMKRSVAA